MMSGLNNTTTSFEAQVISDNVQIETGLSIVTLFANLVNFFVIRKKFTKKFVYHILQNDSLVTAMSQIGFMVLWSNIISNAPNAIMCTLASALIGISTVHFLLSNLLMVAGK